MAFLTTRVKKTDINDWGKLKRVPKYLKGTKHIKLSLSVDDMSVIRWWVDASYNAHEDCHGQTGAMMLLGKGAVKFLWETETECEEFCRGGAGWD